MAAVHPGALATGALQKEEEEATSFDERVYRSVGLMHSFLVIHLLT
jgi:hypothetical protein